MWFTDRIYCIVLYVLVVENRKKYIYWWNIYNTTKQNCVLHTLKYGESQFIYNTHI